jgi:hypothetical protein
MAFIVSSAATFLVVEVTKIAIAEALTLAASALAGGGPSSQRPSLQTTRQPVGPRWRAFGQVRVGGTLAFLDNRKSYLYQLILLNSGEIDSFVSHWLGGIEVMVDGSGNVTVPTSYFDGDNYYAVIDTRLGAASQPAFARLMAAFPGEWTSAHQLNGIACSLVTLLSPPAKNFSQVFPAGLPEYSAVIRGAKVWDPRDESQNPDDSSTWKYT